MSNPILTRRALISGLAGTTLVGLNQGALAQSSQSSFSGREVLDNGHRFFGGTSRGLATLVERATAQWGRPNAYILGQEGSGAFIAGLRFGEGTLFTKDQADRKVFWQGPSLGFDVGGDGARTMVMIYQMRNADDLYNRFVGVDGSAYLVAGFGMTAMRAGDVVIVPIRSGVGARLGINASYLKFTPTPTWNPF
ncbi:MAG: DUF1134 domain-containing protein [Alphaproteobacteria bacterium]